MYIILTRIEIVCIFLITIVASTKKLLDDVARNEASAPRDTDGLHRLLIY
jgi:hypothetical protein